MKRILLFLLSTFIMVSLLNCSKNPTDGPLVRIETTYGDIVMTLYPLESPKTVENFLQYVKEGFYDNTIFHRVIRRFMIQGGGLTPELKTKPTRDPIINEAANGLKNKRGTIAMARGSEPDSARAQFFINLRNNPFLDHKKKTLSNWGYCVFGRVIEGMDVVDKIEGIPTISKKGFPKFPETLVIIKKVSVLEGL